METTEAVSIFQNLAYPIAVSVILFIAVAWLARKNDETAKKNNEENNRLRDQYISYLQSANAELTKAVKENATAFNRFSQVLERIENKINS